MFREANRAANYITKHASLQGDFSWSSNDTLYASLLFCKMIVLVCNIQDANDGWKSFVFYFPATFYPTIQMNFQRDCFSINMVYGLASPPCLLILQLLIHWFGILNTIFPAGPYPLYSQIVFTAEHCLLYSEVYIKLGCSKSLFCFYFLSVAVSLALLSSLCDPEVSLSVGSYFSSLPGH